MREALQRCAQTLLSMVDNLQHASNTTSNTRNPTSRGNVAAEFSRLFRSPPLNALSNLSSNSTTATTIAPASMPASSTTTISTSSLPSHVTPGLAITPRRFSHGSNRRRGTHAIRNNSPRARNGTLTLVCLASKTAAIVPDTESKVNLLLAGLGEKRITFSLTESPRQFCEDKYCIRTL